MSAERLAVGGDNGHVDQLTTGTERVETSQKIVWVVSKYKGNFIGTSWWSFKRRLFLLGHVWMEVGVEVLELTCFTAKRSLNSWLTAGMANGANQEEKRSLQVGLYLIWPHQDSHWIPGKKKEKKKWQQQRTYNTLQWVHLKFLHLVPSLMHDLIHNPINSHSSQPHWLLWFILRVYFSLFFRARLQSRSRKCNWSLILLVLLLLLLLCLVMSKDQLDRKSAYESVARPSSNQLMEKASLKCCSWCCFSRYNLQLNSLFLPLSPFSHPVFVEPWNSLFDGQSFSCVWLCACVCGLPAASKTARSEKEREKYNLRCRKWQWGCN